MGIKKAFISALCALLFALCALPPLALASRTFTSASSEVLSVDASAVSARPVTHCSAWKHASDTGATDAIFYIGDKDVDGDVRLLLLTALAVANNPARVIETNSASGGDAIVDSGNAVDFAGGWNYACGTFVSTTDRRVVLNNDTEVTSALSRATDFAAFDRMSIGAANDSVPGTYLEGTVCRSAVWNVQLTAMEKRAFMNGINPRRTRPTGRVAHYEVWGIHSPELDQTRQKNHMTVTGTTRALHCARTPSTR